MQESGENYLETIFLLQRENGKVRSVDVAKALGFSKPSVSRAMGLLKDQGLIEMVQGEGIKLTKEGSKRAGAMVDKHETIAQFLMMTTDVDAVTAQEDAARMRYFLSDKTYAGIQNVIKQVEEYNK